MTTRNAGLAEVGEKILRGASEEEVRARKSVTARGIEEAPRVLAGYPAHDPDKRALVQARFMSTGNPAALISLASLNRQPPAASYET